MGMKIKKMKGIDLSCGSPSSTAICSSMDQHHMIKNSTKSLNRLNSYLGDHYKTLTNPNPYSPRPSPRAPCISELPFTPRPSSFSTYRDKTRKLTSQVNHSDLFTRRKSSADVTDISRYRSRNYSRFDDETAAHSNSSRHLLGENYVKAKNNDNDNSTPVFGSEARRSTSRVETRQFGSMLDAEKDKIRKHFSLIDVGDVQERVMLGMKQRNAGETCYNGHNQRPKSMSLGIHKNDSLVQKTSSFPTSRDQVVVLRVSLHCRGCENKLRKHLSKMDGVTSYNIDMETKKVTVVGNVTPLDVLTNISKVKNAQFWPFQASSSSTSSSSSSSSATTNSN